MKQIIIKNIVDSVHRQFKRACASEGKTMAKVLREYMEKYIEEVER